jgi:hypothetical protein
MVTFDQNGVATIESQAVVQQKVNFIINDAAITPAQKEAQLRDLYNMYGLDYGTYNRKGSAAKAQEANRQPDYTPTYTDGGMSGDGKWLLFFLLLGCCLFSLGYVDEWLLHHGFNFSTVKAIEKFFQWVFGGAG